MRHILDMTVGELAAVVDALGEKPYRARQIAKWVWEKQVASFAEMSDLPAGLRTRLEDELCILSARMAAKAESPDGAFKCLLELHDGQRIETAGIPEPSRLTACLSTQAGCGMACAFCATGLDGLERNLTVGEIVEQVFHIQVAAGRRVTHAVFMGMGEPLANYGPTVAAVRALIDPERLGMSARRVTISTVGLPRQIRRLASEGLPITLAISLHAPNDALRRVLIPAASAAGLEEIIAAAQEFYESRHRELTLEYVLLAGINDSTLCAEALARIAHRLRCSVNLIPYNPVPTLNFQRPTESEVRAFAQRLRQRGVNVQVRRSRGLEAAAACGQLRRPAQQESTTR